MALEPLETTTPKRDSLADDRGSVTAEFAVVLPAVLMVIVLALGSIMLATHRLSLHSAAAEVARLEARGDTDLAQARLSGLSVGAGGSGQASGAVTVQRSAHGALHCVTLTSRPAGGLLSAVAVSGSGCAAQSGDGE